MKFTELPLSSPILRAIKEVGYTKTTDIQKNVIPSILEGKDLIGCAQTGTGKTAAFSIPLLQLMENQPKKGKAIRTLVLTPTRELAIQIEENVKQYSKYLKLRYLSIYGGVSQVQQERSLRKGVDFLIATPGRLLDLMNQGIVNLSQLEFFVLDEADRMLDMGFVHDVKKVLTKIPKKRQSLFFSATMPQSIRDFANTILKNPKEVSVTPISSTAATIDQEVYFVEKQDKTSLLIDILKDSSEVRSLVFTRTKYGADKLVKKLSKIGIYSAAIHGNKSQNARQKALKDFKSNKINVLVATDIASRGIDIEELPQVINYEIPNVPETYVHRIGRTGRAGTQGNAISLCDSNEKKDFRNIQKLIGFQIPVSHSSNL